MWNIIEYLKDPYLVLSVQRFYGIQKLDPSISVKNNVNNFKHDKLVKKSENYLNGVVLRKGENDHNSDCDEPLSSDSDSECKSYVITNYFWYYLFLFGTELGDEIFYATFIPFWFWNIDGAVGRRVVVVWTIIMYIGQGIKDIICWPRPPSPPVFKLQQKWAQEYGMPSTHAMVGISIPFSVILYTMNRYQYNLGIGLVIAIAWCTIMCVSRIYLGMHSVLDIVAGLLLALILMIPIVPLVDWMDHLILTSKFSPVILIGASILLILFYPKGKGEWTPTRGDTVLIISVCVGVLIGAWTNYQLGKMSESTLSPPYKVIWPTYEMFGLGVLRTVIGMCCVVGTRALCKSILYTVICYIIRDKYQSGDYESENFVTNNTARNSSSSNKYHVIADICHKYFTYVMLGFNTLYLLPNVFHILGIERPTFYTEI